LATCTNIDHHGQPVICEGQWNRVNHKPVFGPQNV